jgi:hypothetical protein
MGWARAVISGFVNDERFLGFFIRNLILPILVYVNCT